jgi:hypothetical protein
VREQDRQSAEHRNELKYIGRAPFKNATHEGTDSSWVQISNFLIGQHFYPLTFRATSKSLAAAQVGKIAFGTKLSFLYSVFSFWAERG